VARSADEVLVVGDDGALNEAVVQALGRANYRARGIRGLKRGLAEARTAPPAVLAIDAGTSVAQVGRACQVLKSSASTRAVLLMILGEGASELASFEHGADDFLAKPCSVRVLVSRVRALLRMHRGIRRDDEDPLPLTRLTFPGVVIDGARHDVTVDDVAVVLTASEFRLLHFLASHEGRVLSRDRLLSAVVGEVRAVTHRNIDVHVASIRRKLGHRRGLLETVRGVGYRVSREASAGRTDGRRPRSADSTWLGSADESRSPAR
jgi:DNA-binding response OmpR family regulator